MAGLKPGKLPDRDIVKICFTASAQLTRLLNDYAELYASTHGSKESAADLIAFMLEAFIAGDAAFRRAAKLKLMKPTDPIHQQK
ncbi:MAG TPA: DUF2274 domain-containing protein [Afifellaceae bacterium]|nr:DUF2274 domain-containing protein [Afifellaceae bacterium]